MKCERCGGPMMRNYDEVVCLHCGHVNGDNGQVYHHPTTVRRNYPPQNIQLGHENASW